MISFVLKSALLCLLFLQVASAWPAAEERREEFERNDDDGDGHLIELLKRYFLAERSVYRENDNRCGEENLKSNIGASSLDISKCEGTQCDYRLMNNYHLKFTYNKDDNKYTAMCFNPRNIGSTGTFSEFEAADIGPKLELCGGSGAPTIIINGVKSNNDLLICATVTL